MWTRTECTKCIKHKKLSPMSEKRRVRVKEYTALRKEFLKQHPQCAVFPHLKATQIHHTWHREGERLNDVRYWLAVSDEGHKKIHAQPVWARNNGFLI